MSRSTTWRRFCRLATRSQSASGPQPPLLTTRRRCGPARQTCPSLRLQSPVATEFTKCGLSCRSLRSFVRAAAYVLLFVGITMLVKHASQGAVLTLETLTDIENYGYSAAWLALALLTMIAGIVRDNSNVRYASLAVLLLVVLKVFLLDMSSLAGLWRVASYFGLGISLVGIGYVYQQFMYRKQTADAEPTIGTKET